MELSMAIDDLDLSEGWIKHANVSGGYYLKYSDGLVDISIVTGPPGSGLMGTIAPGIETTYEAWFPGLANPTGYLTIQEIRGVIRYLHEKAIEDTMYD
jgi:hypothetical protein